MKSCLSLVMHTDASSSNIGAYESESDHIVVMQVAAVRRPRRYVTFVMVSRVAVVKWVKFASNLHVVDDLCQGWCAPVHGLE